MELAQFDDFEEKEFNEQGVNTSIQQEPILKEDQGI